tara:strand:+ start:146 stop:400 length:255 start_codon:yes stop_codon:yes gene_type:complete
MNKRVVEHKIKLDKSLTIILGVLAFGVFLNSFAPAFSVKEAYAELTNSFGNRTSPFVVNFKLLGGNSDAMGRRLPIEFKCIDCK